MKQLICTVFFMWAFLACKESDVPLMNDNTFLEYLESATYVHTPKENLPEWLVVRINDAEKWPSSISRMRIYRGEWNKQTVYFMMDNRSSCFCDFYIEDGKRIEDNLLSDCRATSKNWMLIYKYDEF